MTVAPERIREYSDQTVEYVRRALGVAPAYDSDTLPLLDHYLRSVPAQQTATAHLVLATASAYFGETVIHHIGGRWEGSGDDATTWRVVLPSGLSFSPAGMVGAAILRSDAADLDTRLEAPLRMRSYVEDAMGRMSPVAEDDFYSLCGRLDTLEHVHEVLVAVAAQLAGDAAPADEEPEVDDGDDDEPAVAPLTVN